jgi:hypothetical protein
MSRLFGRSERNFQFHEVVSGLTHNVETRERSRDAPLGGVPAKARSLSLPGNGVRHAIYQNQEKFAYVGQVSWPVRRIRRIVLATRKRAPTS